MSHYGVPERQTNDGAEAGTGAARLLLGPFTRGVARMQWTCTVAIKRYWPRVSWPARCGEPTATYSIAIIGAPCGETIWKTWATGVNGDYKHVESGNETLKRWV